MKPIKQINNVYGYIRVSTHEQVANGSSLENQKQLITEFVQEKYNRPVDKFFIDAGVSGTIGITERPASKELTDTIDAHDVIVATRLDRRAGIALTKRPSFWALLQDIPELVPQQAQLTVDTNGMHLCTHRAAVRSTGQAMGCVDQGISLQGCSA